MRIELLLFFCLACLAFTAQAAPASAKEALLAQKLSKRSNDGKPKNSDHDHDHEHHHHHHHHHKGVKDHEDRHQKQDGRSSNYNSSPLKHRAINGEEVREAGKGLSSVLHPQEDTLAALRARVAGMEQAGREKKLSKQHEVQFEDALHVAKHGNTPPKFPYITRVASTIGLTAAIMNAVNFLFSAKTTALATTQFSAPPSPPTLIDTAALWDGNKYTPLPLPEDPKRKRSLPEPSTHRLQKRNFGSKADVEPMHSSGFVKRRASNGIKGTGELDGGADDPKLSKRWIISSLVGLGLGAAVAPEFLSTVRGKKPDIDKPPFDPYDANMLKPKDSFSAAAADPNQALPALSLSQVTPKSAPGTSPNVGNVRFPGVSYSTAPTLYTQSQSLINPSTGQSQAASPGAGHAGYEASGTSEASPVLRKRTVVPNSHSDGSHSDATSSSELDKRFLFSGGTIAKVGGFITVGSVVPLVYEGVTHARYRTENPRDRDILKELDQTPTYGAVGVPGHVPGQLATNAMPGYRSYVQQLEQQQAQRQAQSLAATQNAQDRQVTQPGAGTEASSSTTDTSQGGDPVLRRRDLVPNGQTRLEKRGWLLGGSLAAVGAFLGYAQSATQFPSDRDAEKDEKKREAKKQQQEMLAAQQAQMGGAPQGTGELPAGPNYAGVGQDNPLASIRPLSTTNGMPGYPVGGGSPSAVAAAAGPAPPSSYSYYSGSSFAPSSGFGGSSSFSGTGGFSSGSGGGGGASSLGASLNAAAGLQASSGGGGGGGALKKRDSPSSDHHLQPQSLSKRTPGIGTALSIGGTTMFIGTLAANLWVGSKQKNKPVPQVTPNANTRGPQIIGGDLYAQYLASKRAPEMGGAAVGGLMGGAGSGQPATVNYGTAVSVASTGGAPSQSSSQTGGAGGAGIDTSSDETAPSTSGANDPVLRKRHEELQKRSPRLPGFAALESKAPAIAEWGTAALARLRGTAAASEAAGASSSLLRPAAGALASEGAGVSSAAASNGAFSRFYRGGAGNGLSKEGAMASEGGFSAMGRTNSLSAMGRGSAMEGLSYSTYRPAAAAWGSARPAMATEVKAGTGIAGTPATIEGAAADGAEGEAAKNSKGMTPMKAMGLVGSGAGATMMMNGLG